MIKDHRNLSRIRNRKLILQQLFNHRETSRAEISRQLNLNKSTVSSIYTELKDEGYIKDVRQGKSTSSGGRKPNLICLNRNYGFVASFSIGTGYMTSMFNYVNGETILYNRQYIEHFDILHIMQIIEKNIQKVQAVDTTLHGLLAIGFSIHGIVSNNKVLDSPFLQLDGIDLKKYYEKEFNVPVILENEANLSAVFENDYSVNSVIQDLVVISIHRGIGMGVIANRTLYRGYRGMAGEIGRTLVLDERDPQKHHLVKIESLCSEDAIISQVKAAKHLDNITSNQLIQLYHNDTEVQQIFERAIKLLAEVTYNSFVAYGPEKIYFNATLFEDIPEVYAKIKEQLIKLGVSLPIQMVKGSRMTSLFGASSLAIRRALGLDNYLLKFKWPREVKNIG